MKGIYFLTGMAVGVCVGGMIVYKNQMVRKMMQEKEQMIMNKFDKAREDFADFIAPDENQQDTKPQASKPKTTTNAKSSNN